MNLTAYIGSQFSHPRGLGGRLSTFLMNRINIKQYASIKKAMDAKQPQKVLDIGFGNGHLLNTLANGHAAHFWGVDISTDMLHTASEKNKTHIKGKNMSLYLGTVQKLPFDNAFFDFIYTVNTVYFWDDLLGGMLEIYRTLSPGGTFVNVFYSDKWLNKTSYTKYGFHKYTSQSLIDAAKTIGFVDIQLKALGKGGAYCLTVSKA